MHRIKVDFPEPEGPHTTMRWPRSTDRLTSSRALKRPKALEAFRTVSRGAGSGELHGRSIDLFDRSNPAWTRPAGNLKFSIFYIAVPR